MIDQSRERNTHMKRSLVILMIILGCLLIGMMIYLYRENQSGQENFDSLDEGVWAVSDKMLGQSWLSHKC